MVIYPMATAGCAEHVLTFGYIDNGPLTGETAWSLLAWTLFLGSAFIATHAVTAPFRTARADGLVTAMRTALACGMAALGLTVFQLTRLDIAPPDHVVPVQLDYTALQRSGVFGDDVIRVLDAQDVPFAMTLDTKACLYVDRQAMVIPLSGPDQVDQHIGGPLMLSPGQLHAHLNAQPVVSLSDDELAHYLDYVRARQFALENPDMKYLPPRPLP